jgi:hypothetical protein
MMYDNLNQSIQAAFSPQILSTTHLDVQNTPLYDNVIIAANTAVTSDNTEFFTNPAGKNVSRTNVTNIKRLMAPEAFSVQSIRFHVAQNVFLADFVSLMQNFAYTLYVGTKWYNRAPIWFYNAGGGIAGAATTTATTTTITAWTNGLPTREAIFPMRIPLPIGNQMEFYGRLEGTSFTTTTSGNGGTGLNLTNMLDGFYARGIS